MVQIPVRKCWHAAKVCFLLVLVVCLLTLFEQWRGGKRSAIAMFTNPEEAEYERQILEDEARIIPGLGEGGVAAHLLGDDKAKGEESEKKLAMNVFLSDRIAYNRTLKDFRHPACRRVVYDAELPSASVIIIFHNEPYSVVLRTVWSVLNSARRDQPWFKQANYKQRDTGATMKLGYPGQSESSPYVYLKEIILVDDCSTLPELKGKLSYYAKSRLPPDMIRILRLPERVGLTRARLAGARYATGETLMFLDSHCEPQLDWLRPLLQRMKDDHQAVVVPIIDVIDHSNFMYSVQGTDSFQVGGFVFTGHFTWIDVPEREKKRRGSDIAPTWSPTMAGGLFAINRAYYWEIGAYDEQMGGWGGENLEMSFRVWQCGGTLETIPCSRVGHVFRAFHPYGLPAASDTHGINTARMAEVWMDEYAELYYIHRPDLRKNPKIGDVTHRKVLREKLQCKSFQWYLDNIYKEKFVPVRDHLAYGRFHNPSTKMCLDNMQRDEAGAALGLYPCHAQLVAAQYFGVSLAGELRDEEKCAEVEHGGDDSDGHRVLMYNCRGEKQAAKNQKWKLSKGRLQHVASALCLSAGAVPAQAGQDVLAKPCDDSPEQRWEVDYSEENGFTMDNESADNELQMRLNKLRGQRSRRISRSLLSVDENRLDEATLNSSTHRRSHRKKHKKRSHKKKNKNKFILRIERTVPPTVGQQPHEIATEHLEVDIRCPHRKLFPNNSFVRDLVSVLNMHDIKVINNGRVFERNRVSQLPPRVEKKEKLIKELELIQPPSEQQRPEPAAALRQLKRPARKHKRPPPPPPPSVAAPPAGPPAPPTEREAMRGVQHKIIIEDFVEMPATTTQPPKRFRLRKRNKHTKPQRAAPPAPPQRELPPPAAPRRPPDTPPPAPPVPQSAREALLALLGDKIEKATRLESKQAERHAERDADREERQSALQSDSTWREQPPPSGSSSEDGPMALPSSSEYGNAETAHEKLQPLRRDLPASASDEARQAEDLVQSYHDLETDSDTEGIQNRLTKLRSKKKIRIVHTDDDEKKKSEESGERKLTKRNKPVKVTMRNNFTFNIGDEFFAWRSNSDDVADILGELAIPSNSSPAAPPIEAWVRPFAEADSTYTPDFHQTLNSRDEELPEVLRAEERNELADSGSAEDAVRVLTGRGMLDDDGSTSASKSESSGD